MAFTITRHPGPLFTIAAAREGEDDFTITATAEALPAAIVEAVDAGRLNAEEAWWTLHHISRVIPDIDDECSAALAKLDQAALAAATPASQEIQAVLDNTDAPEEDERDAKIAALEAAERAEFEADKAASAARIALKEAEITLERAEITAREAERRRGGLETSFVRELVGERTDLRARIAKLEAECATYSEFVEEIIAGEDGWDAELHCSMARHALAAIEEAGRASKMPERRIVDKDAWIAALEERNRVLEAEFARLSRKLGMNDNHTPAQIVEAVLDELFDGGEE